MNADQRRKTQYNAEQREETQPANKSNPESKMQLKAQRTKLHEISTLLLQDNG